jgi:hypothetical protein
MIYSHMELYIIIIVLSLFILICLLSKSTCDYHCKDGCKHSQLNKQQENFVDDYYSFNWTSPTLIDDVNFEKVYVSGGGCSCLNTKKGGPRCTYSMSCDYSDDSAHPRCFAGYDRPADGDLDIPPSFRDFDRNHSI